MLEQGGCQAENISPVFCKLKCRVWLVLDTGTASLSAAISCCLFFFAAAAAAAVAVGVEGAGGRASHVQHGIRRQGSRAGGSGRRERVSGKLLRQWKNEMF